MRLNALEPRARLARLRLGIVPHLRHIARGRLRCGRGLCGAAIDGTSPQNASERRIHTLVGAQVAQVVERDLVVARLQSVGAGRTGVAGVDDQQFARKIGLQPVDQVGEAVHAVRRQTSREPFHRCRLDRRGAEHRQQVVLQALVRLRVTLIRDRRLCDRPAPNQLVVEGARNHQWSGLHPARSKTRLLGSANVLGRSLEQRSRSVRLHRAVVHRMIERAVELVEHDLRIARDPRRPQRGDDLAHERGREVGIVGRQRLAFYSTHQRRSDAHVVLLRPAAQLRNPPGSAIAQVAHVHRELDDVEPRALQVRVPELLERGNFLPLALPLVANAGQGREVDGDRVYGEETDGGGGGGFGRSGLRWARRGGLRRRP